MTSIASITLRSATAADHESLLRVAALDSRRLPAGPHLVAETGGRILAVVSEADGAIAADPFERTADAVEMLREWRIRRMPARRRRSHRALVPRLA